MIRRRIALAYWAVALGFFMPGAAYAYIDPATTTYIIQIITALVVTVGVSLSVFLYRFRMVSAKLRYGLSGLLHRIRRGGWRGSLRRGFAAPRDSGAAGGLRPLKKQVLQQDKGVVDSKPGEKAYKIAVADVFFAKKAEKQGKNAKIGAKIVRNRKNVRETRSIPVISGREGGRNGAAPYILPEYAIPGAPRPPTDEEMAALGVPAGMERIGREDGERDEPGKRGYRGRLRAALPVLLAVCLTLVFFGCIDLAAQNSKDMPFTIPEVAPVVFAFFAACFAVLVFALPLLRGALFEIALSLAAAVLIAGYIQGNFLDTGLGELTGDEIAWGAAGAMMAGSAVFWVCIGAAVFLLRRFARPAWRGLTVFAPFLLVVIQAVALVSVFGAGIENQKGVYGTEWGGSDETLSISGIDELASGKNTVIIVLDRLDEEFVDEIEQADPAFFDSLDGFTKFNDNISYYVSTFPSVTGMLTGHRYYFEEPVTEYFDYAWANAGMMHELKAHGADIRVYMTAMGYLYDRPEQIRGIVSNNLVPEYEVNGRVALVKLLKLSAFRYAPMPAKPLFWLSPTEFADTIILTSDASPYVTNDFVFYDRLVSQRLKRTDMQDAFIYIHLLGAHDPITMDENIQYSLHSTPARQAMGVFRIVYEYLDQMRALGLYEDATIVITGDHGVLQGDGVFRPALTGLFVKPSGSYGTPLAYSDAPVCPDGLIPTVLSSMYGDAGDAGLTYFDVSEGDPVVREYISNRKRYEIRGDGRDFANWEYTGELENRSGR